MAGSMKVFSAMRVNRNRKAGVTLVEVMVASLIISMLSAISFPAYKIIQQREKERRLRKILEQTRAAISGSKSQQSNRQFVEGFRNFVRAQGYTKIKIAADAEGVDDHELRSRIAIMTKDMGENGRGYPPTPAHLIATDSYDVKIATGSLDTDIVTITINRRFLRNIPPHPFKSWYPDARWEFRPATDTTTLTYDWDAQYYGVVDMVSRGAGIALNGSRTDDW